MMPQCSTGKCRSTSPLCSDPTFTTSQSGREGETPLLCHTISYPVSISLLSDLVDQCYHLFLCSLSRLVTDIAQSRVQFPLSVQSSDPERNRKLTLSSAAKILLLKLFVFIGRAESGFKHVEAEKYPPRLLHFKGKKVSLTQLCGRMRECRFDSMQDHSHTSLQCHGHTAI